MREIPLSKGYVALVDDEDYERISAFKWSASEAKRKNRVAVYAVRGISVNKKCVHIWLHRFIMNPPGGFDVDHKDGDGLNCQKDNLRIGTRGQNLANNRQNLSACGFRGVRYSRKKFAAQISIDRKNTYLSVHETAEEAARAYDKAAIQRFGEFARLNFPHEHGHAAPTAGT